MRKLYITLAALVLVGTLTAAAFAAEQQSAAPQAAEKALQQSKETAKKATMEKLERQESKESTGKYIDDAGITTKVKTKFLAEKGLDSLDIKVVTVDGTVTLIGEVDKAEQIALAKKAALEVKGVREVKNELTLKK